MVFPLDDFREFKIFCLNFGIKASVALSEWIRCYRVIFIVIVGGVWILEHHPVTAASKQILISSATGFFYDVWRMLRYWCAGVVHWHSFVVVIISERRGTCSHSTSWLMKPFTEPELVKERKALVELALEFFLRGRKMSKSNYCGWKITFHVAKPWY